MALLRNPSSRFAGRGTSLKGTIFAPRRRPMTRAALHHALDAVFGEWIDLTCVWQEGGLGEHRFVVFFIDVTPEAQVYVQFWADPGGFVTWEVSSGAWHQPTEQWIAGERARRIKAAGFAVGGRARNYTRKVQIQSADDVTHTARAVVEIIYDAFDYRGAQAIRVHFVCDGRSFLGEVLDDVSVDNLASLFAARGFDVQRAPQKRTTRAERPSLRCAKAGVVTTVRFPDPAANPGLYRRAVLAADLELGFEQALSFGCTWPADGPFDPQTFTVRTTLEFGGGVTERWINQRISEWDDMLAAHSRPADAPATSPKKLLSTRVH